jgi:hypothetical protein
VSNDKRNYEVRKMRIANGEICFLEGEWKMVLCIGIIGAVVLFGFGMALGKLVG